MTKRTFCTLAAAIFALIALLQLIRIVMGWSVTLNGVDVPFSQATSVMAWRLYRSAISARLVYLREIGRTAFWEFCNTICRQQTSPFIQSPRRRARVGWVEW
jgi:hypothetical protein